MLLRLRLAIIGSIGVLISAGSLAEKSIDRTATGILDAWIGSDACQSLHSSGRDGDQFIVVGGGGFGSVDWGGDDFEARFVGSGRDHDRDDVR